MGIEYEAKFRATAQLQQTIRQAYAGEELLYEMHTTYYDTPSAALSERRYTLRRRMENGVSVCTLKAPVSELGRGEWETECDSVEKAVPELCKLGAPENLPALVQEGVIAVCGARFQRIAKTVVLEDGIIELALDQGVLYGGGREIPLCEIEAELKSGDLTVLERFAGDLAERYGLVPEPKSKFRRALALYKGE